MHPSGMTLERWQWPFKTEAERALVVKYFRKLDKQEKEVFLDLLPDAPF
jgi:hypothetical protein